MPVNAGSQIPWLACASRGKLQNPRTLTIEATRGNGYGYNNAGYTLNLTTQNTWYNFTINQQVPAANEEQVSPNGGAGMSNVFTVLQAGWWLIHYTCPCTGMDSAQTYQSGVFVNGALIDSGLDTISGVTAYTFGADVNGNATAGLNSTGYYYFNVNDTVEIKARCTTAASKSLTIAINACAFNPMSYCYVVGPWAVALAAQNVRLESALNPASFTLSESDLYTLRRTTGSQNWTYIRVSRTSGRRLYSVSPFNVDLQANDLLDVVTFKQNPAGNTAAPWSVNAGYGFEAVTTRSSGL